MITIKDFMELVEYRITDTSDYLWHCYGPDARSMDSWNGGPEDNRYTISMVFDTVNQTVYELSAYDYIRDRAYRWINPDYLTAFKDECKSRNVEDLAWEGVPYIELDVVEDILEKASAIVAGEDYDTRVMVSVEFSDSELFSYMKLAHEKDMTFNQFVEMALRSAIDNYRDA